MARAIWKGDISFGLVTIPVSLLAVEEKATELHFHLMDSRDHSRVRYERVSEHTGKKVPWDKIVKGYEYDKDHYIELKETDFKKASPESYKSIDIREFVLLKDIDPLYFDKPYYLVPEGKNKKAWVLFREALKKTGKVGVAKVVIRTKEYLSVIMVHNQSLILYLLHFYENLREESALHLPDNNMKTWKIDSKEVKMAMDLIASMTTTWKPEKYHNEYEEALKTWIEEKVHGLKGKSRKAATKALPKQGEVVDFMALLKESMKKSGRKNTRAR